MIFVLAARGLFFAFIALIYLVVLTGWHIGKTLYYIVESFISTANK